MTEIVQDDAWVRACRVYGFVSPPDPVTLAPRQIEIIDGIAALIRGYEEVIAVVGDNAKDDEERVARAITPPSDDPDRWKWNILTARAAITAYEAARRERDEALCFDTNLDKRLDRFERAIGDKAARPALPEAIEQAREICEPLLYQRPCTGNDIENPGLLLWRRDYRRLCARIATALAAAEEKGRRKALDPIQMALGFGDGDSSHARHNLDGAIIDLDVRNADRVCLDTLRRVRSQLGAAEMVIERALAAPEREEG